MLTSIKKKTTSFLAKVLIVIIILPFLFWGMGDVFRGGNQNVLATIDSEKISAQGFAEYLNRLNLNDQQRKNISKTDLVDKILSDYVGKAIIALEIGDQKINLSNKSLKEIIISDKDFARDEVFSRTLYEKFLLKSGITAPAFEQNIAEQEKKRQLLTFLSEGIVLPEFLIQKKFKSENQTKTIQYLELDNFYEDIQIKEDDIKKTYESNKKFFVQVFKKINYVELIPSDLTGQKDYNEAYFKKIDEIENDILDGSKINKFVEEFNLSIISIDETNILKKNKEGKDIIKIDNDLFVKIFNYKNINKPKLINLKNKYYLSEVASVEKITRSLKDKEIKKAIVKQLKLKRIIENNSSLAREISEKKFNKKEFEKFGKKNNIQIKKITLKNIKDETIFNTDVIKEIFKVKDGKFQLITNSRLTKNYIIFSQETEQLPFNDKIKDYNKYKSKAKLNLTNQIYSTFDKAVNNKYDVEINQKVLRRIKNTL